MRTVETAVVLTALLATAWVSQRLGATHFGRWLSGPVLAIIAGLALAALHVLPHATPAYDLVWDQGLRVGLALLLVRAHLPRIVRYSGRLALAFALGAVGTWLGAVTAYALFASLDHAAALTGIFAASYIGGSVNFVSTAAALETDIPPALQAGMLAADNLVMAGYFVLLLLLSRSSSLLLLFGRRMASRSAKASPALAAVDARRAFGSPGAEGATCTPLPLGGLSERAVDFVWALLTGGAVCALGSALAFAIPFTGAAIVWTTLAALALGTAVPRFVADNRHIEPVGTLLMSMIFVTIGASASVSAALSIGPAVLGFLLVLLVVHVAVVGGAGYALRLDVRELCVASNANCGGPATAAAFAASQGWRDLIAPATLCGALGYALATFVGLATYHLLH